LKSIAFVQEKFREYYTKEFSLNGNLSMIERREFGFASFEGWMLRHQSFKNKDELTGFLSESIPRDAYFSCAYYEDPKAEMEKKGWLGADLIFDIDADHIPTPCDKVHDEWVCGKCGFAGKGITPEKCPACDSEKFEDSKWPCEVCLTSAKSETIKLLDMLTEDFGFSEKETHVFFSGHRGYHVHVEHEAIRNLDSLARKEIVDYVCGLGLDAVSLQLDGKRLTGLTMKDTGWRGRIAKGMHEFVVTAGPEDYGNAGFEKPFINTAIRTITKNRDALIKSLEGSKPWGIFKGIGPETWRKIMEYSAKTQVANIDTVVTTDIHRLIRLAGTLHGKTGLKKVEFPARAISDFDPFKSAIAFKGGTATVFVSNAPEFRMAEETFGPYRNQKVELPTAAAVLLVCKKRAEAVEQDV